MRCAGSSRGWPGHVRRRRQAERGRRPSPNLTPPKATGLWRGGLEGLDPSMPNSHRAPLTTLDPRLQVQIADRHRLMPNRAALLQQSQLSQVYGRLGRKAAVGAFRSDVCSALVRGHESSRPELARYGMVWPIAACPLSASAVRRQTTRYGRSVRNDTATTPATSKLARIGRGRRRQSMPIDRPATVAPGRTGLAIVARQVSAAMVGASRSSVEPMAPAEKLSALHSAARRVRI